MPAYNEEAGISPVIRAIRASAPDLDVLVVDDGSRDQTAAVARQEGATVVSHPTNLHYGAALLTGYRYALQEGYPYLVQVDADGQHDPASILTVLEALENGADLVLGSRFLHPESYRPPLSRRLGIALFSRVARWVAGHPITDATTGFQGLSRRLFGFYATQGHFPHDYPDANMIVRASRAGFRIVEVPVRMHTAVREGGMHAGLKPLWYVFKMGFAISVEASRRLPREEGR